MKTSPNPDPVKDLVELIKQQGKLVSRGKDGSLFLRLLDQYELHPLLKQYQPQIFKSHIVAYILERDYLGLSFLCARKKYLLQTDPIFLNLTNICSYALNEDLTNFYQHIYKFIENINANTMAPKLLEAVMLFGLNVLAKYYVNFEVKKVKQIIKADDKMLKKLCGYGHKIEQGYIQLKREYNISKIQVESAGRQKMRQIAEVGFMISKFE